jgi:hypothetical protein
MKDKCIEIQNNNSKFANKKEPMVTIFKYSIISALNLVRKVVCIGS